ncbi:MAG: DUF1499 domain-containing protein [Hellea sp.]|nr:DUF1499 domain-containing protein [Hellea sp.]
MIYLKIIIGIVLLMSVTFFLLGLKSQKGIAKGLIDGRLADCSSKPNCVCSEDGTQPERFVQPLKADLKAVKAAIVSLGGVITSESDEYVSATFMSRLYKFVDDVELRKGEGDFVHIRSASRVGYSDRGVNKKRVAAIRQKLNAAN